MNMAVIIEYKEENIKEIAERLKRGEVGIIPSDTIYGLSGEVGEETMDRIFEVKKRPASKKLIVLSSLSSLSSLGVEVGDDIRSLWPSPLTVILPGKDGDTIAVRVPKDRMLLNLLELSGPIYSTSVNFSGEPPLQTFSEIEPLFKDRVDFIVKKEKIEKGESSTLLDATKTPYRIIRQGAYKVPDNLI